MSVNFERLAADFRNSIRSGREAERERMLASYERMWESLDRNLADIERRVSDRAAAGQSPRSSWESERERLEAFKAQLAERIKSFTSGAATRAEARQSRAVREALGYAANAAPSGDDVTIIGDDARFLNDRLMAYVGQTGNGSPLAASFQRLADDMGARSQAAVEAAIEEGIQLQRSPRQIMTMIRAAVAANGGDPNRDPAVVRRAELAAHSAVMFASRQATWDSMQARGVKEWEWSANRGAATCAACWGNHGRRFTGPMNSHPNCMCAMKPVSESWDDILRDAGLSDDEILAAQIPDTRVPQDGESDFSRLSPGRQNEILGSAAGAAYADGDLPFVGDLAVERPTAYGPQWGVGGLRTAIGDERAEFFIRGGRRQFGSVRERLERAIADREIEHGIVFDADGKPILRKRGDARAIAFTDRELAEMEGATFVHNHPDGESLSRADLLLASQHNLAEIAAVTRTSEGIMRYTLKAEQVRTRDGRLRFGWPNIGEKWVISQLNKLFGAARLADQRPGWIDRLWPFVLGLFRERGEAFITYIRERI